MGTSKWNPRYLREQATFAFFFASVPWGLPPIQLSFPKQPFMRFRIILYTLSILCGSASQGQELTRQVSHFEKIVASHRINLVVTEGNEESVKIKYDGVTPDKIVVKVTGNKLHIYLEDARFIEKSEWVEDDRRSRKGDMYENAHVTAYVTYKKLKGLDVRGAQRVRVDSDIRAERFKLKVYGENEIRLRSLETKRFRVAMYGDNSLRIVNGEAIHQKYTLYGDNRIDARGMMSQTVTTTIYGDGRLSLNTTEELRLNSFGDPDIILSGSPVVSRGIIFGEATITRR